MGSRKRPEQLNKLLSYVLSHRPDEFGLVPDGQGFVKVKEVLKAINEEPGWRYVQRSDLEELRLTLHNVSVELDGDNIRSRHWKLSQDEEEAPAPPKLLYVCVRRRAYPVTAKGGIAGSGESHVVLSVSREMAERLGKRRDAHPVLLTVNTQVASDAGVTFHGRGELLFTAQYIPPGCFTGPPLPKIPEAPGKPAGSPVTDPAATFGSYFPDLAAEKVSATDQKGKPGRKKRGWKEDVRSERRRRGKKGFKE